jgi:membrane fusion protein, multidrug efflux system
MESNQDKPKESLPNRSKDIPQSRNEAEEAPISSVPLYRNFKLIIPLFVLVFAISVAIWYWYVGQRDFISTDDAYIDADRVSVSMKMLGRITQLTAKEGDTVNVGQPLVYLDDSDLRAQQQQAEASLILAKENVKLAKVSIDKALQDFERAQAQLKDKVIPQEQLDHAQKELETMRAKYAIAQAQVGTAEAQQNVIVTQLQNTTVASPMHGVISKRWVLSGDVVQPGQAIYSIYNLDSVWVTANLEETKLHQLKIGDQVKIVVDAYPEHHFSGTVGKISTNTAGQFSLIPPSNASGNFTKVTQRVPVKIYLENNSTSQATPLLPGMSVEIKVRIR